MGASTLGDIMLTAPVEWEQFAKEWSALGQEGQSTAGVEIDNLTNEMINWGKKEDTTPEGMRE